MTDIDTPASVDPESRFSSHPAVRLGALLWCAPRSSPLTRAVDLALASVGIAGGFVALASVLGPAGVATLTGISAALVLAAGQARGGALAACIRWSARAAWLLVLGFFGYEALAFGSMLSWALPWWAWLAVGALAVAAVATHARALSRAPRVALVVPLGGWIAACVLAWSMEIGSARCDDYLRAVAQPSVEVLVASASALRTCAPGERLVPSGHPRKLFAGGAPHRYFTTVQRGFEGATDPTSTFTGGLCELALGPSVRPPADAAPHVACRDDVPPLYGLAYRAEADELLLGGGMGILRVSARPPYQTIAEQPRAGYVSTLVYVPEVDASSTIAFFDDMERADRFAVDDLQRTSSRPLRIAPEEVRYDRSRHEGLYCFASTPLFPIDGRPYLTLAVGTDLTEVRPLGSDVPWAWLAFSDGCDVDLETRIAYVGVATLGVIAVLDYDSGALVETHAVGFGVRPLLLDARRRRLYAGNYLDGWVRELDAISGEPLRRWFVGRFVRHIVSDPSSDALLVTSTLGVVRIDRSRAEGHG